MNDIPFITSETELATYLILSGFKLLKIQYEPRTNGGRLRGFYIFQADERIEKYKTTFDKDEAVINLTDFKETKASLLDRIMNGLP
jgi:c-di-GMP-related signal transduction protein